jgi:tRNA(His) guanylyltransferase
MLNTLRWDEMGLENVAHINNLYNTTFWALVQQGKRTTQEAHSDLKGTFSKDKHSILFDRFQINYNNEPEIFKKGSILIWSSLLAKLCANQQSEAAEPNPDNNLKVRFTPHILSKDLLNL